MQRLIDMASKGEGFRLMRSRRACRVATLAAGLMWLLTALACVGAPPPSTVRTRVEVRVPAPLIEAHLREHPLLLFGARDPGTLEHRGFLLAVICSADADVTTEWTMELEGPTTVAVWVERGYADNPNTPCGITPEALRRDLIAEPFAWHPHASAQLVPGQAGVRLVLEDNGTGEPAP